jgi:hypothetical protein
MKATRPFTALLLAAVLSCAGLAQEAPPVPPKTPVAAPANPWQYNLTIDGYVLPNDQSYVNPTFTADRKWLHLEARYNYENLHTGSLWVGYNFSAGKKLVLDITPMIGGVFGRTTGIAPGCEASLTYKQVELSISNEYVFDTSHKSGNFYYSWPQLTYSPLDWLRVGLVAQHTKAFQTSLSIQRGFLVGFSHKRAEFTTYVFNAGQADPTVVLEVGYSF